jgi:hypothetical protein
MEKLEIKLTLSADSTPELLRYLRGISSARDRAFVLKRLATTGLSVLNNGSSAEAILLPSPAPTAPARSQDTRLPDAPSHPAPIVTATTGLATETTHQVAAPPEAVWQSQRQAAETASLVPRVDVADDTATAGVIGFEFLDLDALNAATAQFG